MGFNRVHLDGSLGGGVESWSTSCAFNTTDGAGVLDPGDLNAWAEEVRARFSSEAWATTLKALMGSNSTLDKVRIYGYALPTSPAVAVGESTGAAVSGANSLTMPPQCSLVFSLRTGFPGRTRRGRMYWPCLTSSITAGLKRGGNPTQAAIAQAVVDGLESIANAAGVVGMRAIVVSKVDPIPFTPVSAVSVGDVIDTQRRRRDQLVEVLTTAQV